jgi:nitroimidazol reductase NimA-like FMN-containing flavoprotein (pyridoxamine 5'-phosphate oxidase superfamily)
MSDYRVGENNKIRQAPNRARYDRAFVHAVLDEGYVAHVGFVDDGRPMTIPLYYVRVGEELFLHGSRKARVMRVLAQGCDVSVAVTHLDGLVLARSAFHHSMNYRSVIVYGRARPLQGEEKAVALDAFVNRLEEGRADLARRSNASEDKATLVLAIPLDEVAAKTRTGPPVDDEADMQLPVRAGIVPVSLKLGSFEPDES